MQNIVICTLAALAFLTGSVAAQEETIDGYAVTPGIVYGTGTIKENGIEVDRDLWMDMWQPTKAADTLRPTVIFTHGGSWHLGSPRFKYDVGGAQTTSPAEYCKTYASRGYNCFAIEYRLTQENPVPSGEGYLEEQLDPAAIRFVIERINLVRIANGLPSLDPDNSNDQVTMLNGIRAATEDLNQALNFILANAETYRVNPKKIALHGFSAGAVTSVHVAYALNAPVAAVVANSGGPVGFDITATVTADSPPLLLFVGQHDLEGAIELAPAVREIFKAAGAPFEFAWVPGAGHFYSAASTSLGSDALRLSIDERVSKFLSKTLGH